jgi:hypothetical protein
LLHYNWSASAPSALTGEAVEAKGFLLAKRGLFKGEPHTQEVFDMKKVFSILVVISVLGAVLTGCSGSSDTGSTGTTATSTTTGGETK